MKPTNFIIRIPEPCHENWSAMQPDIKGKFCGSCCKSVFDFSNKTDIEIRDILMTYKDQKICGHFKKTQINRPLNISIHLNSLPRNLSSTNAFAIAIFIVFGTFLFSCTNDKGKKIETIEISNYKTEDYTTGLPLLPPTELMGDIAFSEDTANTSIKTEKALLEAIEYDELAHLAGGLSYEQVEVENEIIPYDTTATDFTGSAKNALKGTFVTTDQLKDSSQYHIQDSINHGLFNKVKQQSAFNEQHANLIVSPNPGTGQFLISYEISKKSSVRIDIFDLQGAWLKTIVNNKEQFEGQYHVPLNLSEFSNGVYLVNMINEGKRLTEKLIIEK